MIGNEIGYKKVVWGSVGRLREGWIHWSMCVFSLIIIFHFLLFFSHGEGGGGTMFSVGANVYLFNLIISCELVGVGAVSLGRGERGGFDGRWV